jgi:2-methylisocitrate lyase-like PEP mutase family enzyme
MASPVLRQRLDSGEFIVIPGVQDMIAAAMVRKVGFPIVYGSGYWLTASSLGLPDAGIATYTQMLDRMTTLVRSSDAAVIADGDTGYGGLLNVHHTVRGYEAAGVTAIQLEDQEFPKKCGHTPFKRCVPTEDMVEKIRVAVDARADPDFLIIARTDARAIAGVDEAAMRCNAALEAGADMAFFEAAQSLEELAAVPKLVRGPCLLNMVWGGKTPLVDIATAASMGYRLAILSGILFKNVIGVCDQALRELRDTGRHPTPGAGLNVGQVFARVGAAEWDARRTLFREVPAA